MNKKLASHGKLHASFSLSMAFFLSLASYAKEGSHELFVNVPDLVFCSQYKDTSQFYEQGACSKLIYDFNNKLNFYWGSKENKKESLSVFMKCG